MELVNPQICPYGEFVTRLGDALQDHAKETAVLAAMVISLDALSQIDGAFGYAAGDRLIALAGMRIREALRSSDLVGLIGRGEFGCMLDTLSSESLAVLAAEKVTRVLSEPFEVNGRRLRITPRVGVAFVAEDVEEADRLLRRANAAMQEARRRRASHHVFEAGDQDLLRLQFNLQTELEQAIKTSELFLSYQPQLDLRSDRIGGAEALLRWTHLRQGAVSPREILYIAERAGLMSSLTAWVISTALRQCAEWRRGGLDLGISVNVSTIAFPDAQLIDMLDQALGLWEVPADRVVIELSETISTAEILDSADTLARIRERGIKLSTDNFGIGESSMTLLRELPINEIKISRSFVTDMLRREFNETVVRSMIDLGRSLRLRVVANGVDDSSTCELLRSLGCDVIQGRFVAPPLPLEEFVAIVQSGRERST